MGNIYSALKKELKNKQREEERRRKEEEKAKQVFLTNLLDPQLKCTLGNVINNLAGSSSHHQPSVTVFAPWPVSHKSHTKFAHLWFVGDGEWVKWEASCQKSPKSSRNPVHEFTPKGKTNNECLNGKRNLMCTHFLC